MSGREKQPETPSLEKVILQGIEDRVSRLWTSLPGEVVKYDASRQKADVKICVKKRYASGEVVEFPVLPNVPIMHLRAGASVVHVPLKPGHSVTVFFASRSIDRWKKSGGSPDPADPRKHSLSDAFIYPGLYPFSDPIEISNPDALSLINDQAIVEFQPEGKFKFQKKDGDEIVDLLVLITDRLREVCAQLEIATTNTIFGALQLNNFAQFGTLKTQVEDLKDRLDELKGV